ncbi:MAG: Rne/Rng family ribonuclease [Terriglobia bacterium]
MTKELLISSSPHETKVAVLEDDQVVEVYFQRDSEAGLVGGIYKGRVNRVLPGMQSAFVDIGLERDAFLYVSDFFEESEEYDRVFTEAENRVARAAPGGAGVQAAAERPSFAGSGEEASASAERLRRTAEPEASSTPQDVMPQATEPQAPPPSPPSSEASIPQPEASAAAASGKEEVRPREFRGRDFPGRRHRRRPGFRDSRAGSRREPGGPASESRNEAPSHPLEPLPGESLAKYGRSAEQSPDTASEPRHEENLETLPTGSGDGEAPETQERMPKSRGQSEVAGEATFGAQSDLAGRLPSPEEEEEAKRLRDRSGENDAHNETAEAATPGSATEYEEEEIATEGSGGPRLVERFERESEEPEPLGGQAGKGEAYEEPDQLLPPFIELEGDDPTPMPSPSDQQEEPKEEPGSSSEASAETGAEEPRRYSTYSVRDPQQRPHLGPRRGRRGGRGRFRGHQSGRPESGGAGGNHQPLPISELLKEGQEILVQIAKEPLGTKGARITSHIALPGRYLVYMPTITHIGVSRKIASEEERLRLRNLILDHRGSLTGGFIVRTAGAGRSDEDLIADLAFLTNLWNEIRTRAERSKAPALLHRDLTLIERILRDLLSPDFKRIRIDNEIEYEHVLEFVDRFQPALIGNVKLYTRDAPMFEEFGVQGEIDKALKPKVWLKSGGYIVINQTEALVAIDVNTGKFTGKTNRLEDTIVKTNIDAVMEIVRQIRLRDLGGIIVIDFIDMDERRNRAKVVQALEDALRRDRAPAKILSFNEFGLVALTRKRAKQSLERTLCEPCPYCVGAGWVKSISTVSHEILAESRKMAAQIDGRVMTLRVSPQVATALKSRGGALIAEIEGTAGKEVVIKSDASISQERFEIF